MDNSSFFNFSIQDIAGEAAKKLGLDSAKGVVQNIGNAYKSATGNSTKQTPTTLEKNPIIESAKAQDGIGQVFGMSPLMIGAVALGAFLVFRAIRK